MRKPERGNAAVFIWRHTWNPKRLQIGLHLSWRPTGSWKPRPKCYVLLCSETTNISFLAQLFCRLWNPRVPLWSLLSSSTASLVTINIERYLGVVHPLFHKTSITKTHAVVAMIACWISGSYTCNLICCATRFCNMEILRANLGKTTVQEPKEQQEERSWAEKTQTWRPVSFWGFQAQKVAGLLSNVPPSRGIVCARRENFLLLT